MATIKKGYPILLPTNEASNIYLIKDRNKLGITSNDLYYTQNFENSNTQNQHLYILSDEEIKEGDWVYNFVLEQISQIIKANINLLNEINRLKQCKKIIATTDSSLVNINCCIAKEGLTKMNEGCRERNRCLLPQPSPDFIKAFVEEYNKGNVIEWVDVEYGYTINKSMGHFHQYREYFLKVNSKNEITIRKIKDSWTREEIEEKFRDFATKVDDMYRQYTTQNNQAWNLLYGYGEAKEKWISDNF